MKVKKVIIGLIFLTFFLSFFSSTNVLGYSSNNLKVSSISINNDLASGVHNDYVVKSVPCIDIQILPYNNYACINKYSVIKVSGDNLTLVSIGPNCSYAIISVNGYNYKVNAGDKLFHKYYFQDCSKTNVEIYLNKSYDENITPKINCHNYYYFDNKVLDSIKYKHESFHCLMKGFCGDYMYEGLHTFLINQSNINESYKKCLDAEGSAIVNYKGNNSNNLNCKKYYYFDNSFVKNNAKSCKEKTFCGLYMYQGLRTFNDKNTCNLELNKLENNNSNSPVCKPVQTLCVNFKFLNKMYNCIYVKDSINMDGYNIKVLSVSNNCSKVVISVNNKNYTIKKGESFFNGIAQFYGCKETVKNECSGKNQSNNFENSCKKYYYFDNNFVKNNEQSCKEKTFCGLYMYNGLRTFNNESSCNLKLKELENNNSNNNNNNNNQITDIFNSIIKSISKFFSSIFG